MYQASSFKVAHQLAYPVPLVSTHIPLPLLLWLPLAFSFIIAFPHSIPFPVLYLLCSLTVTSIGKLYLDSIPIPLLPHSPESSCIHPSKTRRSICWPITALFYTLMHLWLDSGLSMVLFQLLLS